MPFAHGGEAGGPNFEALILAVPMVVVGIILFVQKSAKPVVSVLLVLGGITLALGGFTFLATEDDHDAQAASTATRDDRYADAVRGLCEARARLIEDDASGADALFEEAHPTLHDIAARLSEQDRTAAAELLEAKQDVESAKTDVVLSEALDRLIIATVQGLAELDEQVAGCD